MQQTPSPMPYSQPSFFARRGVQLLLVAALLGAGAYALTHSRDSGPKAPPPVSIRTAAVVRNTVPLTVEAVGNVVAYESVAVRSRLDSQVIRVHFKDGEEVKKGDLLFELDDSSLRAQAAQLAANIARDKAQLDNARRQQGRAAALAEKGFATKAVRDDSEANTQVAQATVGASVAALDSIKAQLAFTRITAPISGRTGTINVTVGNTVKANDTTPLVTINQVKPIRVQASLPQTLFDSVREAMRAGTVTVTALKQDDSAATPLAQGTLEYLDNEVNQSTGTFVTRAGFDNPDERLWPGMFVTLTMTLGDDHDALSIPEVAVQHGQAGDFVYVIAEDKAARRDVKIARIQHGTAVIASGLSEGETVAVDGILGLKDGAAVSVKQAEIAAPVATAAPATEALPPPPPAAPKP